MSQQKGFGAVEAVVVSIAIIVIGVLGWKFMDMQNRQQVDNAEKQTKVQTEDSKKSLGNEQAKKINEEDEKIAVARVVCTSPEYTATDAMAQFSAQYVQIKQQKYAHFAGACAESEETAMSGSHAFVHKENNKWVRVTSGNGDLYCDRLVAKGFPEDFVVACQGPSLE